jgi:pimeloyl-ACP methyl ester carboxylesterase
VADNIEDRAIVSSIPTLVLAGQYDPVTPPDWGRIAASTLANSFFYEFPGVGHDAMDSTPCAMAITLAFLDQTGIAPDDSCLATMGPPQFVVP